MGRPRPKLPAWALWAECATSASSMESSLGPLLLLPQSACTTGMQVVILFRTVCMSARLHDINGQAPSVAVVI